VVVDYAVYERGARLPGNGTIEDARARRGHDGSFVWVALVEPTAAELETVGADFGLHELAVEDAVKAHQRPKLERYGDTLFLVVKTVVYDDPEELVETGEVMLFLGADFLVSVRHGPRGGIGGVREELERRPELLAHGPSAAMYGLVDRIVDGYRPVADALADDIEELEADVFSSDRTNPVERIYRLRREVLEFHRAVAPLGAVLAGLVGEDSPTLAAAPIRAYLRDVADHVARLDDELTGQRELLGGILQANLTQVSVRQNEDMRKISAWVAILAVPTMVAGIYGMNFEHMPELEWRFGYPAVLAVVLAACAALYVRFRRAGWL
jgi:magnesium transporter